MKNKGQSETIVQVVIGALVAIIGLYVISVIITQLAPTNQLFAQIIFGGVLGAIIVAIILALRGAL